MYGFSTDGDSILYIAKSSLLLGLLKFCSATISGEGNASFDCFDFDFPKSLASETYGKNISK